VEAVGEKRARVAASDVLVDRGETQPRVGDDTVDSSISVAFGSVGSSSTRTSGASACSPRTSR
jgi:hypothetical protein